MHQWLAIISSLNTARKPKRGNACPVIARVATCNLMRQAKQTKGKIMNRTQEIDVDDGTVLVVIDDAVEFKVCKTETGYKFLFLESKTDTIDIAFSDNVEEFEN